MTNVSNIPDLIQKYKEQIETPTIYSHNYIVVVNDYNTVTVDENNKLTTTIEYLPTQFTYKVAKEIINKFKIYDKDNNLIKPQMIFWKDFYKQKIKDYEEVLQTLTK